MSRLRRAGQAGFSVIELAIALTILTLLSVNISMVMKTSSVAVGAGVLQSVLEDQAQQTMDRISLALMSADPESITLPGAPNSRAFVDYTTVIGYEGDVKVSSDPERIERTAEAGLVRWIKNPDMPETQTVVWSSGVPAQLEGETANENDDNGNGLVDEEGLSFDAQGPRVSIRFTLQKKDQDQKLHLKTLKSVVTCRN